MKIALKVLAWSAVAYSARAQAPSGTIAGIVRDQSGAAVAGASLSLTTRTISVARTAVASNQGHFSFSALPAGEYAVSVEALGFQRVVREALVQAGVTTTSDFILLVGDVKEFVSVNSTTPQMRYDSHAVGGVIARGQIERLPLNGRTFLELAKLEPGILPPTRTNNNRTLLSVLGAPGSNVGGTRFTVDGGSVTSVGVGGSQMSFSQEVVQEFQVSTVNFDLSAGIAAAGSISVVTRSGSNDYHGAAFFFFRDRHLAAYPTLTRYAANPDPFFQRRQFGFASGGPVRRNRIFYFANWERSEQRGIVDTNLLVPEFAHFSRVTPTPAFADQVSFRADWRIGSAHSGFVRYSHDGSRAVGPISFVSSATGPLNGYPSTWARQSAWADQSLLGFTSVFRPTLVNDLRFSYFFISSGELPIGEQDCPGCMGIGAPAIAIPQAGLYLGRSSRVLNLARRFQLNDSVTWQNHAHRVRFGVDWEHSRGGSLAWDNEPGTLSLFSPDEVRASNTGIPLPTAFRTLEDILRLPLQTVTIGVGDPRVAQEGGSLVRRWNTLWLYFQDTWRLHDRLTLTYGLGWSFDGNLNFDLTKPVLLSPILGAAGLGPTRRQWRDFSPALGLAWTASSDGKTVIRAGAGHFYGLMNSFTLNAERAALGPPDRGRYTIPGTSILNTLPGIPGVPLGRALNFPASPSSFTGADMTTILFAIRAERTQSLSNADPALQTIQITKQISGANNGIFPSEFPRPSALHASLGVQRQLSRNFVFSADVAYRHFVHMNQMGAIGFDLNRYNRFRGGLRDPVLPVCNAAQASDPDALCSRGPINVMQSPGRATYKGLLVRAEKRFSGAFQALGSYTYSTNTGTNFRNGFNLDNWLENRGPLDLSDFTHMANVAGVAELPWRFDLGLNFSCSSAPGFSAYLAGIDFNGDGTTGDLLPGTTVNTFNRGMDRADLQRFIAQFNTTHAGTMDAQGRAIPSLTLPARYAFGDNFHSLDLRLSRTFEFGEFWQASLIGEVFNVYNKANLSGHTGDLTSAGFGQPTSRASQVFGSGGPRAFQLAIRLSF